MDSVDKNKFVPEHLLIEGQGKIDKNPMPSKTPEIDQKIERLKYSIIASDKPGQVIGDLSGSNVEILDHFDFSMDEEAGVESLTNEQIACDIDVLAEKLLISSDNHSVGLGVITSDNNVKQSLKLDQNVTSFTTDVTNNVLVHSEKIQKSEVSFPHLSSTFDTKNKITEAKIGIVTMYSDIRNIENIHELNKLIAVFSMDDTGKCMPISLKSGDIRFIKGAIVYDKKRQIVYVSNQLTTAQYKSVQAQFGKGISVVMAGSNVLHNFLSSLHERLIVLRENEATQQKGEDEQSAASKSWTPSKADTTQYKGNRGSIDSDDLGKPVSNIKRKVAMSITEDALRAQEKKHKREKEAAEKARDVERQEVKKQERKKEIIQEELKKKDL